MLMVNDRRLYADTFWFTLFHEIGHVMNGNFSPADIICFSDQINRDAGIMVGRLEKEKLKHKYTV